MVIEKAPQLAKNAPKQQKKPPRAFWGAFFCLTSQPVVRLGSNQLRAYLSCEFRPAAQADFLTSVYS